MRVGITGPAAAVRTAASRLGWLLEPVTGDPLGRPVDRSDGHTAVFAVPPAGAGSAAPQLDAEISWHGPAASLGDRPASEATIQARCGLMHLHGKEQGRPRRLGLPVASTSTGLLATHGVLAALIARQRGCPIAAVDTSVLQGGLALLAHYLAVATCAEDWVPPEAGPGPGPPFATRDGRWVELETLDAGAWRAFWSALGVPPGDIARAWPAFRARYETATCRLPTSLHASCGGHSVEDLARIAAGCGVSLCPVRTYDEVLDDPGRSDGLPAVDPLPGGTRPQAGPSPVNPGGQANRPLRGLRVVEATSRIQGPLAGLLLRMLGAEVVHVEPPGGDPYRMMPPAAGTVGALFQCVNRGKSPVELDLNRPSGRDGLLDLVREADAFLHNWRPGKAGEWRLDIKDLARCNPTLVYAAASGWGRLAHMHEVLGTDFLVQAWTGVGQGLTPVDEPPAPSRLLLTDYLGALIACEGILAGLYLGTRTGRGYAVHSSLLSGAMTLQEPVLTALAEGRDDDRRRDGRPVWGPLDRPLETTDGFVAVDVTDTDLGRVCEAVGVDPGTGGPAVHRRVAERLRSRPAAEWEQRLAPAGVPCATVASDLTDLPAGDRLGHLFEPIGGSGRAPRPPWAFLA